LVGTHYSTSLPKPTGITSRNKSKIVSFKDLQNNQRENAKCSLNTYNVGDQVMVKEDPHHKCEGAQFSGPYTVNQVYDNGTVQLSKTTNGGAVLTTWNIRNVKPC
jgi:hypothetical protein